MENQRSEDGGHLPAREDGPEVRLGKDASNFFAFISLDFDLAIFHGTARAAGLLHRLGQALLLRQTDADKALHHRNSLPAAPGLLPDNVHASSAFSRRWRGSFLVGDGR